MLIIQVPYKFIYEILTGLHSPQQAQSGLDFLAGRDDDLPVNFGHYNQDLDIEGGQGVMRVFIDLSLNYTPHKII